MQCKLYKFLNSISISIEYSVCLGLRGLWVFVLFCCLKSHFQVAVRQSISVYSCLCVCGQMAFDQYRHISDCTDGGLGIYLLTDGKPDTSMSMVLNEVRRMNSPKQQITVNTISFNCSDRLAAVAIL